MKNDLGKELSRLDALTKSGYGYIINNAGRIIAFITVIVATLVTFTNVSFSAFTGESFTVSLIIMLCASYVMYFALESSGERLGESTEEFLEALNRYKSVRAKISADDIGNLREFCLKYTASEADYRRKIFLAESGLTTDEYEDYKKGKFFEKPTQRLLYKCDRIKPARLTPSLLLSKERLSSRCELSGPERTRIISILLGLLPTTLGTFFTVSIMLTAKSELTMATVIEGIVKLSALPMIGFKGYTSGYSFVKNVKSNWIGIKTEILEEFLSKKHNF